MIKQEVYFIEDFELEELFDKHINLHGKTYDLAADFEASNDSLHRVNIDAEDIEGHFIDFVGGFTTKDLMIELAMKGVIPFGTYIIEFCW